MHLLMTVRQFLNSKPTYQTFVIVINFVSVSSGSKKSGISNGDLCFASHSWDGGGWLHRLPVEAELHHRTNPVLLWEWQ